MKSEVKQSRQQRANKDSRSAKQRHGRERDRDMDDEEMFTQGRKKKKDPNRKGAFIKPEPIAKPHEPEDGIRTITLPEKMTIKELSDIMKVTPSTVIKNLFMRGQVVTLNHEITFEEAEEIALEYNCIAEMEEKVDKIAEILKEDEEDESLMVKRPPVVCVMGHVDHGKTSLLDAIRETSVTSREAGGITQHIGAYVTEINGEKITFLDTPGHEAFTSMRMRGAQSTDIAILVVAADDGVMPQTIEAISHAKAAGVEIIVAVNKIDKPSANIERVKQELTEHGLIAEDWGGDTVFVPVSAHTKEGRQQALHHVFRPLFERFRHDGVVGVRHRTAYNLLRFVPAQAFFVHQQAHQFRNRQTRMRVVDVDDDLLRQLAPVRAVELLEVLEDVLEGGGGEEILLLQAEQLAFVVVVFRVEDVGDSFRQFLFLRRLHIVAVVEVAQVNALRGAGAPQAQAVDGGGVIAHQRHVVGDSLDRVVADVTEHRAAVLVAHFDVTVEVHFAGILHYGHFPHVAVAQPVVRQLDLLTVHNLLAEQTVFIADGAAHRGQVEGRQRVHEARCQTAQTAVAQRGFRLFLKHLVYVDVQFVQRLLVGIERDEVQDVGV